jgi:hypothetical protein
MQAKSNEAALQTHATPRNLSASYPAIQDARERSGQDDEVVKKPAHSFPPILGIVANLVTCAKYLIAAKSHYVVVRTFPVLNEPARRARNLRPGFRGRTDPGMPFPEPETALASTIVESVEVRVT